MVEVNEYKLKNIEIEETIKLFNNLKSSFSREELKKFSEKFYKKEKEEIKKEEINKSRRRFHRKEAVYNYLKEKDSLTKKQGKVLKK